MTASMAIKQRLRDVGMSQVVLAAKLGTTRQNISNKLSRDNFTAKELARICDILDLELVMAENHQGGYTIEYSSSQKDGE